MSLGKHYSVFCTESTLENVFFMRKRETFCKNVGVKGDYLRRKANFLIFFELRTKKRSPEYFAGKIRNFPENRKFFSVRIDNFWDRIHDPQIWNQIDAAGCDNGFKRELLKVYFTIEKWRHKSN